MNDDSTVPHLLKKLASAHFEPQSLNATSEDVARTVCAFLNTGGGTILAEAGPSLEAARLRHSEIEKALRQLIKPPAFWSVAVEPAGHDYFCIVDVPAGRDRPYTVEGAIFVRQESRTVRAAANEIRSIVESSFSGAERWERHLMPEAGVGKLDKELILKTAEQARAKRNFSFSRPDRAESVLAELGLYRQNSITNAAEVLFGRRPAIQFPQVRARVTVYQADKGGDFIDNRTFEGPLFRMLEEVFSTIRQHTPVASVFRGGLRRSDQPAFPEEAVREGLVNAFAHRDYADFSGGIAVDLYPSRLVIWNSGELPPGIKIGDLKREHPSMPRNPDITQVLYLREYMERVGRGTQNIVKWCREAGLPPPKWSVDAPGVTLTLSTRARTVALKLNLRERSLLDELKSGATLRLPEYCGRLAVSERQGRRDLGRLVQSGWLEREGEGPATIFRRTGKAWEPAKPGQTRPQ